MIYTKNTKKLSWIFISAILCPPKIDLVCGSSPTLKFVAAICRHGDRNIIDPYPNDPYRNESFWPGGFGQLTNAGKLKQYQLGAWLRNRYKGFLPAPYSVDDIHIRSADVDRCIMSAQANLAGLYPPVPSQQWLPNLPWQPIPVHTVPENEDALIPGNKPCPKYKQFEKELYESEEFKNISEGLKDLYAYCTNHSGEKVDKILKLEYIYDELVIEKYNNFTLPTWTDQIFSELKHWAGFSFRTNTYNTNLARLQIGPLFHEIVENLQNVTKKFMMYCGHDITVSNVLNSMGLFNGISPPFASMVLFELKEDGGKEFVNILYKNETEPHNIQSDPYPLTLEGCEFNCELDQFVKIVRPFTISMEDWETECYSK